MLGILALDTAFPRIRGDVGAPDTFDFPVRIATVARASVDAVVHERDDALLGEFVAEARNLAQAGCAGIVTTCGFLVRWQDELAAAVDVPVLTSPLLLLPLVQRMLPRDRTVGVVTYSAASLSQDLPGTPLEGVDPGGYFARLIRHGAHELDPARMSGDVVDAARRLVARHRGVGAIVLECANMPPYRDAVVAATGLPVFDAAQFFAWFHAAVAGSRVRRDLW